MKASVSSLILTVALADVAPVAVFHGVNSACPMTSWTDRISAGIKDAAVVKCVEIGNGKISSMFEKMDWQIN